MTRYETGRCLVTASASFAATLSYLHIIQASLTSTYNYEMFGYAAVCVLALIAWVAVCQIQSAD